MSQWWSGEEGQESHLLPHCTCHQCLLVSKLLSLGATTHIYLALDPLISGGSTAKQEGITLLLYSAA